MEVLSTATYGSNTSGSPPAHVSDSGLFSVSDVFCFWTGLLGWPQGPFHTGLVSISTHHNCKHELRLNPQQVCFVFCHESKSIVTQVCFRGNKLPRRAPKQNRNAIVWKGLIMEWSQKKEEGRCNPIPSRQRDHQRTAGAFLLLLSSMRSAALRQSGDE